MSAALRKEKSESMPKIGLITGSGFYDEGMGIREFKKITTPYGEPSDVYRVGEFPEGEFVLLSRHGTPHHIPPHMINYRANIWGMREMGVERIISVNAVGGIEGDLVPGDIVVPDQVIDMTHGRASTFYEGDEVVHIDFTTPYCTEVRGAIKEAGIESSVSLRDSGTYVCVNGPRLESRAEIQHFFKIGADIVGMTVMPEACLARELELCFAGIAVVTNYAAGISGRRLTTKEVVETMKESLERLKKLVIGAFKHIQGKRSCECSYALKDATI
jgi:5'-methylthioadenosine phosphorylase